MMKGFKLFLIVALFNLCSINDTLADGTEGLGPLLLDNPIASGTSTITSGTGFLESQPGTITVDVPSDVLVKQVFLYWHGLMDGELTGDDTVTVNGNPITGNLIGGPRNVYATAYSSVYRADITNSRMAT